MNTYILLFVIGIFYGWFVFYAGAVSILILVAAVSFSLICEVANGLRFRKRAH
jgi:hypothetical protein